MKEVKPGFFNCGTYRVGNNEIPTYPSFRDNTISLIWVKDWDSIGAYTLVTFCSGEQLVVDEHIFNFEDAMFAWWWTYRWKVEI